MDKITYLAELAEGLARWVPERERQDILRYYAEYFEEAGPEREAEVIQELGDPWALSSRLAVEGGFVTQQQAASWAPKKRKKWPWIVAGVAAALVCAVVSVAVAAVRFGGLIGRHVADDVIGWATGSTGITVVEQEPEFIVGESEYGFIQGTSGDAWGTSTEAFDSISADISLGNITVVAGDDYTIYVSQIDDLGGYRVKWEVKDGTLKLRDSGAVNQVEVGGWDDFKNLFGRGQRALDVIITVPDGVMALNKVSVKTGLGNVMLYDVPAAKVTAETGMGNVECYNLLQVEKLDLDTGMGDVTLGMDEPCGGVDIDLESGMGNVEATLGCSEAECEYELESGMGNVTVNGSGRGSKIERKGNALYKLDAESGMGDVNVYFWED